MNNQMEFIVLEWFDSYGECWEVLGVYTDIPAMNVAIDNQDIYHRQNGTRSQLRYKSFFVNSKPNDSEPHYLWSHVVNQKRR